MTAPMRSAQQGCSVEAILIRGAEPAGQLGRGLHGWRVEPPEEKAFASSIPKPPPPPASVVLPKGCAKGHREGCAPVRDRVAHSTHLRIRVRRKVRTALAAYPLSTAGATSPGVAGDRVHLADRPLEHVGDHLAIVFHPY
jgi:hypothetical protein